MYKKLTCWLVHSNFISSSKRSLTTVKFCLVLAHVRGNGSNVSCIIVFALYPSCINCFNGNAFFKLSGKAPSHRQHASY